MTRRTRWRKPMRRTNCSSQNGRDASRPLLGVPVAVKDVLAVKNQPLNCGSKILGKFISPLRRDGD